MHKSYIIMRFLVQVLLQAGVWSVAGVSLGPLVDSTTSSPPGQLPRRKEREGNFGSERRAENAGRHTITIVIIDYRSPIAVEIKIFFPVQYTTQQTALLKENSVQMEIFFRCWIAVSDGNWIGWGWAVTGQLGPRFHRMLLTLQSDKAIVADDNIYNNVLHSNKSLNTDYSTSRPVVNDSASVRALHCWILLLLV